MTKLRRVFASTVLVAAVMACLTTAAAQSAGEGNIANVVGGGSAVRWDIGAANAGGTLTITFPDGRAVRKTFRTGNALQVSLGEKYFENLPDGVYVYELRLAPQRSALLKEAIGARAKDDEPESERAGRKRLSVQPLIQSGSFAVVNGSIVVAGAVEPQQQDSRASAPTIPARTSASANVLQRIKNNHRAFFMPDFVIADDLIVQGSACVGLDCVNNENFGFDTIRMKENNTRLQYDDTSSTAGFATNNWQIRANSSANGGGSFLAFVDQGAAGNSETGTIIFEVDAGAPANSLRVSSSGNVGIGTATPVLDVHANTGDTPAIRLEQNNGGGFAAQTWDIAGNEANFFVRDVTSGSRLPFRIRPGAPTSSIDISASGNVGIGTQSPASRLTVENTAADVGGETYLRVRNTVSSAGLLLDPNQAGDVDWLVIGGFPNAGDFTVREFGVANYLTIKKTTGRIGIGTAAPDQLLSVNGDASKAVGGGSWQVFSDERLKSIHGRFNRGLKAVMQLQPLRYEYKSNNALGLKSSGEQVGFSAQSLMNVVPEAVRTNDNGYLSVNNDPILWTMLNAIKEQQKQIEELKAEVRTLKARARRNRR